MQLDWFGTALAERPKNHKTFQFASYAVEGGRLRIRRLNREVIRLDISSSEKLVQAILKDRDHSGLYRDAMVFEKVKERAEIGDQRPEIRGRRATDGM